jgi:hypothetical protein
MACSAFEASSAGVILCAKLPDLIPCRCSRLVEAQKGMSCSTGFEQAVAFECIEGFPFFLQQVFTSIRMQKLHRVCNASACVAPTLPSAQQRVWGKIAMLEEDLGVFDHNVSY